jgi:gliding motility-associated-like protein
MTRLTFLVSLLLIFNNVYSQLDTLFWFVAPEVAQNHGDRPIVFRFSTLSNPATITISQPANSAFPTQVLNLPANSAQTLDLTPWIDIIENKPANTILNYGFKISATTQITAYYEVTPTCNCNPDIFSLKGKNSLGTSFLTPFQNFLNNASYAHSGFNIVATEDNTNIVIVPTQNIVGHIANIPFTINLNKGQTFCVQASSFAANLHLGGSSVVSNKKIAITLHDDTAEGTPYGGCADLQGDQLIPISILGMEYIAIKGYLNGPDKVYVLAASNGTQLTIDGVNVGTINLGQTYVHTLSNPSAYIVASDSVYVLHQSGFGCEVGEAILPPIICTGSNVVPFTRSTNEFFAVNILVPAGGQNNFTYNGATGIINGSSFNFVPSTGNTWMYAQLDMSLIAAVQQGSRIENSSVKFHLGLIHGGSSSGCRYGYFSDFASLRYDIQSNGNEFCQGDSINLVSNVLPGGTYLWAGPNNFNQVGTNIIIPNAQLVDSGIYVVYGQLPGSCALIADSINITIHELPETPLIYNDGPWCESENGKIWHNIPQNFNAIWTDLIGNTIAVADTFYYTSNLSSGSFSINLQANNNICSSGITSQTIQVFAPPLIEILNSIDVCGDSTDLISNLTPNIQDPIDSIYWKRNISNQILGFSQNLFNINAINPASSTEKFIVKAISQNGCVGSDTIEIAFHSLPEVSFTYSDLCNETDLLFEVNNNWIGTPSSTEFMSGQLNFGDGSSSAVGSNYLQHSYSSSGVYSVNYQVESNYGCKDSFQMNVVLYDQPNVTPIITSKCGQKAEISAMIEAGNFIINSLNWQISNQEISDQLSFIQFFESGGDYSGNLTITGENNCIYNSPFDFSIDPSVGIESIIIPNVITANDDGINEFIVFNELFENCNAYQFEVLNRWGQIVYVMTSAANPFNGKDHNGEKLLEGVYYYKLKTNKEEKKGFISIVR